MASSSTPSSHPDHRPVHLTFDYDYQKERWNLSRGAVPPQLKTQGIPHALWMHFWDFAQSVVERSSIRHVMKKKLRVECNACTSKAQKQERLNEIRKLQDQTTQDFEGLRKQAERLFPNTRAKVSTDVRTGRLFGLDLEILYSSYTSDSFQLAFDDRRGAWSAPRHQLPIELAQAGVPLSDWAAVWDYAFGVHERAKERESLNELHERELILCQKSLSYMNNTHVDTVDQNASSDHNTTASHIRMKMEKLQRAKEANSKNTDKGWQELQRRANQRFSPYGVTDITLMKVENEKSGQEKCIGVQMKCPQQGQNIHSSTNNSTHSLAGCSVWLPMTSTAPSPMSSPKASTTTQKQSLWRSKHSSTKRDPPPTSSSSSTASSSSSSSISRSVLSNKSNTEWKENAPPKPEKLQTFVHSTKGTVFDNPVVLTYVHGNEEDHPAQTDLDNIEVAPLPSLNSSSSDLDGLVIPPAPTDPPSSIGSSSSSSIASYNKHHHTPTLVQPPPVKKQVRFGITHEHVYDNPYTKMDRTTLWFTAEDREACRHKTKALAQRVLESRKQGKFDNTIFMDSETHTEVCWRGLEHAQRGNLHYRQDIRRSFLNKVLEKQHLVRMASMASSRTSSLISSLDPAVELQYYASRLSRTCRERAQKRAAQDAKDARTIYKESLRKTNLIAKNTIGASSSSSSGNNSVSPRSFDSRLLSRTWTSTGNYLSLQRSSQSSSSIDNNSSSSLYHHKNDIFQDYCRQMHLASKASRIQQHQQPKAIAAS